MVRAGWVARTRAPRDGRAVRLALTGTGEALAGRAAGAMDGFLARLAGMSRDTPLAGASRALWSLVAPLPSGRALKRRRGMAR